MKYLIHAWIINSDHNRLNDKHADKFTKAVMAKA